MENIHRIWKNRKSILEGIKNNIFKKDDIEEIAAERMVACMKCPHISHGDKCMVPGTQPCCGLCGCKLSWKLRSLAEYCPDPDNKRWDRFVTDEEEVDINKELGINPHD